MLFFELSKIVVSFWRPILDFLANTTVLKYFTIKRSDLCVYVFIDDCKQIGNIFTFIRIKAFILCKDKNKKELNLEYEIKMINEEISVNSSYFDTVELYRTND